VSPVPAKAKAAPLEEIAARAARLGITPERVLLEYAHIAFADLRHVLELGSEGWRVRALDKMTEADAHAISEIVPGSDPEHPRVKLYDRKAALDAIARHLGMFPAVPRRREDAAPEEEGEDPREFLARELARLAAGAAEE
jgi:terminase small subunit-like protein